jgi:hypothetical protein
MLELLFKYLYFQFRLSGKRLKLLWLQCLLYMPASIIELRYARRMDRIAQRLLGMQVKLTEFEQRIRDGYYKEEIDGDNSFRSMLKGLKEDIRTVRLEVSAMHELNRRRMGGARLDRALTELRKVAEDTYGAADRLLWEIDQHDLAYH